MIVLSGCTTKCLTLSECKAVIAWVNGGTAIAEVSATAWLLAHCDNGVAWGKREDQQSPWLLSNVPFPKISPLLTEENLQQLRLFGAEREVLVWRTETGFAGRVLEDDGAVFSNDDPLRPKQEPHVLVGDRLLAGPVDGFSLVGDARGSRHAVPVECTGEDFLQKGRPYTPWRLQVRHYFTQEASGVVRVAASRLVNLTKE
jgi:CRISPR-associated protein (TIGR03984 family)